MNKLNNNGWGTTTFIAFLIVFLLALLIISILAYRVDKKDNIPLVHEEYIIIY